MVLTSFYSFDVAILCLTASKERNNKTRTAMVQNEQQFTDLVRQYKSTIYAVCYMFSKDADEVNDLFQEVLINIWKGMDSFEQRSDIRTWIYRVSLNTCVSAERKKKRQKTIPLTININLFEDDDAVSRQADVLHKRITRLKLLDRAIILLWLENLSYDEIAAILGISVKNVSVRLVRIREQLKTMNN